MPTGVRQQLGVVIMPVARDFPSVSNPPGIPRLVGAFDLGLAGVGFRVLANPQMCPPDVPRLACRWLWGGLHPGPLNA